MFCILKQKQFLALVRALRQRLPKAYITLALMPVPNILNGSRANYTEGFAPGVLAAIAAATDKLNLMTCAGLSLDFRHSCLTK